ncbi:hypothetical protein CF392_16140 [Tamilnaduibacter salinus]|uniref:Uncharacterized protein n=1 Tax=Tamilnaduibacter salinus TaxID=1484056 RepID=A0A2A2HZN3_9GAMM|nr:hypothetical protein CF392_16140 [Tamilnaduibacter salinus]
MLISATRLNEEPSITVTLVREGEDGALKPWVDADRFAWELSQLQARESLAKRLPEWPQALAAERERLVERFPGLKFSRLWIVDGDIGGMAYSAVLGLHRSPR